MNHIKDALRESVERNKAQKTDEEAMLRKLCDGARTVREVASRMGWGWDKTRSRISRLGLEVKRDR